jgi:hypothetical protein
MKRVMEPIVVTQPFTAAWTLSWRERSFHVETVLAQWFFRGKWWLDPSLEGERRTYLRLSCTLLTPPRPTRAVGRRVPTSAAYSMTPKTEAPGTGPSERILEVFQRIKEGTESWVLSGVVD